MAGSSPSHRARFVEASTIKLLVSTTLCFGVLFAGCKKRQPGVPKPAQVHATTQELARAARATVSPQGRVEVQEEFASLRAPRPDRLRITLSAGSSEQASRETVTRITQALNRIASTHGLTREPGTNAGSTVHLNYLQAGVRTHTVEIRTQSATVATQTQPGAARLAIILDDLGNDRASADAIFALSVPITLSVLPNHPHSVEIAEEAQHRGYEVMLHLPMQSVGDQKPESQELQPGMAAAEVTALVDQLLRSVPAAVGVNNHQGSQSTADLQLMDELMPVLREHNLFYVDSRTTTATVAYDTAQRLGVRSGFRNTPFLDDVTQVAPIRRQLQLAFRNAQAKGAAIAIGHPHPATLQALKEVLPEAKAQGVHLVFASEVVH